MATSPHGHHNRRPPTPTSVPKKRLRAGEEPGVGGQRYRLIRSAAERVAAAMNAGFWLEAITLVESMLAERMEKRIQYLHDHDATCKAAGKLADGFANLGPLVEALRSNEADPELRTAIDVVGEWKERPNVAVHQMAKFGVGAREKWAERLEAARGAAQAGIDALLAYDGAERRVSHASRKKRFSSATCPDALRAIGQLDCPYCSAGRDSSGEQSR